METKRKSMMCRIWVSLLALVVLMAFGAAPVWAAETAIPAETPLERATAIALQHAQLEEDAVIITKLATDRDNGRLEYEVEFIAGGMEYDYEIDAETWAVLKASTEKLGKMWSGFKEEQYLAWEEAKEMALAAVGATAEQAVFTEVQFDFDDRRAAYEVEFTVDGVTNEVDVDAVTGEVLKRESETARHDKDRDDDDWHDD